MTVRERILALRVLEAVEQDPDYAKKIGVSVKMVTLREDDQKENGIFKGGAGEPRP